MPVNLPLLETPPVDYGTDEPAMARYRAEGTAKALAMDNRGPIRFGADGKLDPAILESYTRHGFYVFEGVLGAEELADLERDVADLIERAPVTKGAEVDKHGRPPFNAGQTAIDIEWVKPLSDPFGGTDILHGRHQAKMIEPTAPEGAPEYVMQLIHGTLQHSVAALRLYGHPQLLAVAEAINGPDFVPFNEGLWIKHPRLGGSVAWHQDPWTHWNSPDLDEHTHGFNFMPQLYGCDAANGLWVVPGSHRGGKKNIKAMVAAAGSDRLPDAVPLICAPGDVAITSRQAIHGSFANTSDNVRVTFNMGFHKRSSVLGVITSNHQGDARVYDDAFIRSRSRLIMYAIDARRQRFPSETPYRYAPLADEADTFRWTPAVMPSLLNYNAQDLSI